MNWSMIMHFNPKEFDSPDEPGSGEKKMDIQFVALLDDLRDAIGEPLKINSGYRSPAHNKKVGGKPNSAHLRGKAADIKCEDWDKCFAVVHTALEMGVQRIGIQAQGKFVHIDVDGTLPQPRIWFYP